MLSIILVFSYLVSLAANIFVSLKHPDGSITTLMLGLSILLLIVDLMWIKNAIRSKWEKSLKIFAWIGLITGPVVYLIATFDFLEIVSAIQYPLYVIFITPFFGLNRIFNFSYQQFSLIVSVYYLIILIYIYISNKKSH